MQDRRAFLTNVAASAAAIAAPSAFAQASYPERPITVVCTFAPGGSVDPILRAVQPKLSEYLGQPIIIDNRPGAGTAIGEAMVHKAAPDGYTLGLTAGSSHVILPIVQPTVKWDPIKDFTQIATLSRSGWALVVHPDVPVKTVAEFVAYMKANPGKVSYGSSGVGTGNHLQMARFLHAAKVEATHVPYKVAQTGFTDVIAGRLQAYFTSTSGIQTNIDAGKLRALVYTARPDTPAVQKFASVGLPALDEIDSINMLFGPAGMPAAVVSKIAAAVEKAVALPETKTAYASLFQYPYFLNARALTDRLRGEYESFTQLVKETNIKIE